MTLLRAGEYDLTSAVERHFNTHAATGQDPIPDMGSAADITALTTRVIALEDEALSSRRTTDNLINNSVALAADAQLLVALAANTFYAFRVVCFMSSATATPDWKFDIATLTGATGQYRAHCIWTNGTIVGANATALGTSVSLVSDAAAWQAVIDGQITVGSTAGNLQLRWAQNTATVEDTKMLAGSFLQAWKIA